jgi:glutaminyl-peptide cyclotransferase
MHTHIHSFLAVLCLAVLCTAYTKLSDASLNAIPSPGKDFDIKSGPILAPILQVRVPGTPGSEKVRNHFYDFFAKELPQWTITLQNSTQKTALRGQMIQFINVIATRDPPWTQPGNVGRLALVAHYDSKITPKGFIGATDSAAPVAMILHAARSLDAALTKKWDDMKAKGQTSGLEPEQGIQLILLDGEEAFVSWTDTDSIYGARYVLYTLPDPFMACDKLTHLSAHWQRNGIPKQTQQSQPSANRYPKSPSSFCSTS